MLIKNKNCTDYTEATIQAYRTIRNTLGYSARISNLWELLKLVLNLTDFEILTPELYNNSSFLSYLVEEQIKWMNGEDVDFGDIYEAILTVGDFTEEEKRTMVRRKIEELLWGIFLAICDPELNL